MLPIIQCELTMVDLSLNYHNIGSLEICNIAASAIRPYSSFRIHLYSRFLNMAASLMGQYGRLTAGKKYAYTEYTVYIKTKPSPGPVRIEK